MNDSTVHSWKRRRGTLTLGAVVVVVLALAFWGEPARLLLRYERAALIAHEPAQYWRLLTAHLVHGSWQHTWVNLAGLLLMIALFRDTYRFIGWLGIIACSVIAIDLGLMLRMPQLAWYLGLSGVLHGVLAAGAVAWWKREAWPLAAALTFILLGKLAWEQWQGALPLSGELPVIINAHVYGAMGGGLGGLIWMYTMPRGVK